MEALCVSTVSFKAFSGTALRWVEKGVPCPALPRPLSVTENCHCCGRHGISGHENNKLARVCLECSALCSNRHDFDSNNISKQFLNLADRKNTNHLDKCVSSTFWRGAMRIYPA